MSAYFSESIKGICSMHIPVLVNDMQTTPQKEPFPFFVHIVTQCSETNEKSIFFIFIFSISVNDFDHNFQVCLTNQEKKIGHLLRCPIFL